MTNVARFCFIVRVWPEQPLCVDMAGTLSKVDQEKHLGAVGTPEEGGRPGAGVRPVSTW